VATRAVLFADIDNDRYKVTLARPDPVAVERNCSSPCGSHFKGSKVIAEDKWRVIDEFFVTVSSHAGCGWEVNVRLQIGLLGGIKRLAIRNSFNLERLRPVDRWWDVCWTWYANLLDARPISAGSFEDAGSRAEQKCVNLQCVTLAAPANHVYRIIVTSLVDHG